MKRSKFPELIIYALATLLLSTIFFSCSNNDPLSPKERTNLLILGDSVTSGYNSDHTANYMPTRNYGVAELLMEGNRFLVSNFSSNALTSRDLMNQAMNITTLLTHNNFNTILMSVGNNDLLSLLLDGTNSSSNPLTNLSLLPNVGTLLKTTLKGNLSNFIVQMNPLNPQTQIYIYNIYDPLEGRSVELAGATTLPRSLIKTSLLTSPVSAILQQKMQL